MLDSENFLDGVFQQQISSKNQRNIYNLFPFESWIHLDPYHKPLADATCENNFWTELYSYSSSTILLINCFANKYLNLFQERDAPKVFQESLTENKGFHYSFVKRNIQNIEPYCSPSYLL